MRCAVFNCNSDNQVKNFTGGVMFFSFPADKLLIKSWTNACRRSDKINPKNARVCSKHFNEGQYIPNLKHKLLGYTGKNRGKNCRKLKPDAVPTENLPHINPDEGQYSTENSARNKRADKRSNLKIVQDILNNTSVDSAGTMYGDFNASDNVLGAGDVVVGLVDLTTRDVGINTVAVADDRDATIAHLRQSIERLENDQKSFEKLFTPGQMKKLKNPECRPRWSVEEISKAIVIYSAGPRAYRLLLRKGYPFPAPSTLRSWLKKIKISPGILKPVFNVIKLTEMTEIQKISVLSFDEMKVRKIWLYDKSSDETLKPYAYVQVVMLRGLFGRWKQPIFYDYDCKLTKKILFEIISYVENSGFQVVAMVSDLGGGNRSLLNELEVNSERTWFENPANHHKIYVFADVPHLLKLIRNHFVDKGFMVNGTEISKSVIEKILDLSSVSDLKITHKISKESLYVKNAARQKVKLAAKLFSHTVSRAITRCGTNGDLEGENWTECAEIFKLINDWFDCFNVRVPEEDSRDRKKAYGLAIEVQSEILNTMTNVMKNLRVKGKSSLLPFQIGIIMCNTSLPLLFENLEERFQVKYILTYRLNQDVLENFFGVIRSKGGLHDHPDALEFKYRLRSYILGKNEGSLSAYGNVEEDDTPDLPLPINEVNLGQQCFSSLRIESEPVQHDDGEFSGLVYDGLENLAGYICHKLKEPSSSLTSSSQATYTWVDHLSEGGLSKPSEEFMAQMEQLEIIFNNVNSDTIFTTKEYLINLINLSAHVKCSDNSKKLFFRSRMFFRMRQLNKDLANPSLSRKRKMSKIVN